jgi:hypothetical protein
MKIADEEITLDWMGLDLKVGKAILWCKRQWEELGNLYGCIGRLE